MTYLTAILKRNFEAVLMFPFVAAGKLFAPFFSLETKHNIFIFCPAADIGGSIKVNADLCSCFIDKKPLVIFSKKPRNNEFLDQFKIDGIKTIDLHRYVDNKLYHFVNFFYRGVISSWINKTENPIVIGGESLFFYKVLPHIKSTAMCADVCHLNTWFNYTQAFIKDLDARIFSTSKLKRDAEALYLKNKLPEKYYSRLYFVDNKVDIPLLRDKNSTGLKVLYVGRGALQKRVHILAAIAKELHRIKSNIHFSFVGDVEKIIDPGEYPYCTFYGNIKDKNKLQSVYRDNDVLLLTSAYEGLPIAVMEMMALGKVVVSTAVDGIPDYIKNGENGFLLANDPDENKIIAEGISVLQLLEKDKTLLKKNKKNSRLYAEQHFSGEVFCESYRQILLS